MKVLFLFSIGLLSLYVFSSPKNKNFQSANNISIEKTKAFKILKTKCNVCHVKQNRKKVFTLDNMDLFAPKIHKQVFIKKRMPRGKKIILNNSDYTTLKTWLKTLNIK